MPLLNALRSFASHGRRGAPPHTSSPHSNRADASYLSLVLDVGLGWQQHPERVNAEGGTEGDVEEERNKREYDSERARPRLSLQQTPAHDKSCESFYDHDRCNKAQEGMQERGSLWMGPQIKNGVGYDIRGYRHQAIECG